MENQFKSITFFGIYVSAFYHSAMSQIIFAFKTDSTGNYRLVDQNKELSYTVLATKNERFRRFYYHLPNIGRTNLILDKKSIKYFCDFFNIFSLGKILIWKIFDYLVCVSHVFLMFSVMSNVNT